MTEGPSTAVTLAVADGHAVVTLDGAATRNAIGPDVNAQLAETLAAAASRDDVAAIVLHGANGYLSSGGNIGALTRTLDLSPAERRAVTDRLASLIGTVRSVPVPVIAAVEGGAAGIGLSLMLAADLVIASETARFQAAQIRVGLTPDGGLSHFLMQALPRQLASEMILSGARIEASRLARFGLINQLVAEGDALGAAQERAAGFARGPRRATARAKALLVAAEAEALGAALAREADAIDAARTHPEAREGLAAFREKRPPDFSRC